jgi:hypothetical protein
MKTMQNISKKIRLVVITMLLLSLFSCDNNTSAQRIDPPAKKAKKIKLAILLDTSNSMDGLIDQAKSQLWSIVNELAKAECDNTKPALQIALYEYGNDNLPSSEGYIRLVTPLTTDLDQISEDLFGLSTNGGNEYCGEVIQSALKQLDWSASENDYQVIFIAGNEPFTQGRVDYHKSCAWAKEKGIVVNTIFCGDFDEGIRTSWKNGATLTGGNYFSIEQNRKTVYIESPYDDKLVELNQRLNNTYIYYGTRGQEKKLKQAEQDVNSQKYGKANMANRVVAKSSHVYKNSAWDLVDASEEQAVELSEVEEAYLPQEMKGMSTADKEKYIEKKKAEREEIQKEIQALNVKRSAYMANKQKEQKTEGMLDNAIISSIQKQANSKSFTF